MSPETLVQEYIYKRLSWDYLLKQETIDNLVYVHGIDRVTALEVVEEMAGDDRASWVQH